MTTQTEYPNPVAQWCRSTTDADQRVDLVARVLTAAAELTSDPELAAALDDIAAEHRYLSRVWDWTTQAVDYFETNRDEYRTQALAALADATDDDADPNARVVAIARNAAAHARMTASDDAARIVRSALNAGQR